MALRRSALLLLCVLCVALVACQGCQPDKDAMLRNDLKSVGLAYISFFDENKKSPANWEELISFAERVNLYPDAAQRVRDAGYTMTWGANLNDQSAANDTVLASPPGTGPKLMMNGRVE
jgi:hypothetical protein